MRGALTRSTILLILGLGLLHACSSPAVDASPAAVPALPTESPIPPEPPLPATPMRPPQEPADTIFYRGNIITMDRGQPLVEALAIRGNLIQAVGFNEEILVYQGEATILIDLQGKTIMPGITDGHSHYVRNAFEADVPLEEIQHNLLRFGLTGDTEMHSSDQFIHDMLQAELDGKIDIRLNIFGEYNCGTLENGRSIECISWYKDNPPILDPARMVRVPGVKIFADGAGTTARGCPAYSFTWSSRVTEVWPDVWDSCKHPYGDLYLDEAQLTSVVQDIQDRGFRAAFHAMGDATIDHILNALEGVLDGESNSVYRHQILHNSVLRPDQLERYVRMDILANVGGIFNVSEAYFYEVAYGEDHYAWNAARYALPNMGVHVFFGQDYNNRGDVNQLNPFPDLNGYVTHREFLSDGSVADPPDWVAQYKIGVERALEILTIEPAFAVSMEEYTGSLKAGKYADLIIISGDPLTMDADDLYQIAVLMTMVNGEVKYCAPGQETYCSAEGETTVKPPAATEEAAPQAVQVKFNCDAGAYSPPIIHPDQFLLTNIKWGAANEGQVNDFLGAVEYSVFVNGNPIQSSMDHDEIQFLESGNRYAVLMYFDVGYLQPGEYEIRTVLTFSRAVFDGSEHYGPGTEHPALEGTCTLTVE